MRGVEKDSSGRTYVPRKARCVEVFRMRLLRSNAGDTTEQDQRAPSKPEGQASQVIIRDRLSRLQGLLLELCRRANSVFVASISFSTGATV